MEELEIDEDFRKKVAGKIIFCLHKTFLPMKRIIRMLIGGRQGLANPMTVYSRGRLQSFFRAFAVAHFCCALSAAGARGA